MSDSQQLSISWNVLRRNECQRLESIFLMGAELRKLLI